MKKHFRKMAFILTIITLFAFLSAPTSYAAIVDGTYNESINQYTAISNTAGYSNVRYSGLYYGDEHANNRATIYAECRGGQSTEFLTRLHIYVQGDIMGYDDDNHYSFSLTLTSESEGSRYLQYTFQENLNNNVGAIVGYVEETCANKTNGADQWSYQMRGYWRGAKTGWS